MYQFINAHQYPAGLDEAARYLHNKWGDDGNYPFYCDVVQLSAASGSGLPQFFWLTSGDEIVGCYGLIVNDFISRHYLWPWLCCLYVAPEHRGQRLSGRLLEHAGQWLAASPYASLYLTTDHDGFYEQFGWRRLADGYDPSGQPSRIYGLAREDD